MAQQSGAHLGNWICASRHNDLICDPACCGTAGFLIAASEHLVAHHNDTIYKSAAARRRFNEHTFHGYAFDSTMLPISSMNMLLRGLRNADIPPAPGSCRVDSRGL